MEYMIKEGKLWQVASGHHTRAWARVECVTRQEAVELAGAEHKTKGHWQQDSAKATLLDHI